MRWRKPSAQKAPFERFADWVQLRTRRWRRDPGTSPEVKETAEIDEAGLVLMAALEEFGGERVASSENITESLHDEIASALLQHSHRLGASVTDWKRFREITGEVDVN